MNHAVRCALWIEDNVYLMSEWVCGPGVTFLFTCVPEFQNLWVTTVPYHSLIGDVWRRCSVWLDRDFAAYQATRGLIHNFIRLGLRMRLQIFSRRGSRMNHIGNTLMRCWRSYRNMSLPRVKQPNRRWMWMLLRKKSMMVLCSLKVRRMEVMKLMRNYFVL